MRKILGLLVVALLPVLWFAAPSFQQAQVIRYVSNTSPTCNGQSPCHPTMQAAVNAAQPGDTIRIQAGTYTEAVLIKGKNAAVGATEADRIVIEADPAAPLGSVMLGTTAATCVAGTNLQIESSKFITIRGLTIAGGKGQALTLAGGAKKKNAAIHIERNRILGNGTCKGGLLIGKDNADILVVNNLIHGSSQHGVNVQQGVGGPHYLIGNTIHGNGKNGVMIGKDQNVWLLNNLITGNGADPKSAATDGFGVKRRVPKAKATPELAVLLHNLVCGNAGGELNGAMLDSSDAGNLTPLGTEGTGVSASPGCNILATLYANLNGADAQPNTEDDDFTPTDDSPAVDSGIDPRTLSSSLPASSLEADFLDTAVRPQDGGGGVVFDIGAIEKGAHGGGGCSPGENRTCYDGPAGTEDVGVCHAGTETCLPGGVFGPCTGQVLPGTEILNNGIDENCDGHDAECVPDQTGSCYTGPTGTAGVGICRAGTQTCGANGLFGACAGETLPATEIPNNGIDEDCNGSDQTTGGGGLPPDPGTVAPAVEQGVATILANSTAFLYTGNNPIQTGVAPGTIESKRAAVIRGKVLDRANAPLSGVKITILNHSEFGQTLSRADGMFDMAVNGGGLLTINYEKAGFLPAQRQVSAPWQDFVFAPDVVLIAKDVATTVNLSTPGMKIARGSTVTDSSGARNATVLIPEGTQAQVYDSNGVLQNVTTLDLRLTEYTVGSNGPQAMPGPLPPTSGYTYAVELGADEAIRKIAGKDVIFLQHPVFFYVDNFLNFPIGLQVPVGYYDKDKTAWIPSPDGKVIKIVSIPAGQAEVDTDGDGTADNTGLTSAERQQLGATYTAGQSLWRVPMTHFSTYDLNYGTGAPAGAQSPGQPPPGGDHQKPDKLCKQPGSIIGCQDQTLGEVIGVTGTPFALHYASDRVPGRIASNTLQISLSGATPTVVPKAIELEISIAGQVFKETISPFAPNLTREFPWDGKDAFGRKVEGRQEAKVRLGYVYQGFYNRPPSQAATFGLASGQRVPGNIPARQDVTLWQEFHETLGTPVDQRVLGIGGWSLTTHHGYDPIGKVLYQGDGIRRSVNGFASDVITTVAGTGTAGYSGDGGPATQARLNQAADAFATPDGSVYVADFGNNCIRQIAPDGIITRVGGMCGVAGFSGDGGPATQAQLNWPLGLTVVSDNSLVFIDGRNNRIRRIGPDGVITTIVGNGQEGFSGDGGPATKASIRPISGGSGGGDVVVAPDGALFFTDCRNNRIRRVGPDGIITTIAGNGAAGFSGDGGPATLASLRGPLSPTLGLDGSIYFTDSDNNRVRRISTDGIITTIAGAGVAGFSGDGGAAIEARVNFPLDVAVGRDQSVYFTDGNNARIRRVDANGIISTVGGTGQVGFTGDGGSATRARLNFPDGLSITPEGSIVFSDDGNNRIRRISPSLPGFTSGQIAIPSEDGTQLYQFDATGRHLKNLHALTGATLYEFLYDSSGRLVQVKDGDNNITTIERNGSGNPTAIVGPFGQRTTLTVDANGYLASIKNPANETHQFTYTASGLMTAMQDPKNNAYQFTYDALGRLTRDDDPAGGSQALSRVELGDAGFPVNNSGTSYEVTRTTGLGRAAKYRVGYPNAGLLAGAQTREVMTNTFSDGTTGTTTSRLNGTEDVVTPDGTKTEIQEGPDPRFGMQAPVTTSGKITTPGNLVLNTVGTRTITPTNPSAPFNFTSLTDAVAINSRTYTSTYTKATRTFASTTPQNRTSTTTIDAQGRVTKATIPGLQDTNVQYDSRGRLASISQGTGIDARTVTFTYRPDGYLDAVTDPLNREVSFAYDAAGRVTSQTLPGGRVINFDYDANGNLISLSPPGRPAHQFDYTAVDLQSVYTSPSVNGGGTNQTTYAYNADRQLEVVTRPDGKTIALAYESTPPTNTGRPKTLTIGSGTKQYSYAYNPTTGNLSGITAPGNVGLAYVYDGSLLKDTTWSGTIAGSVNRTYDTSFRLATIKVNSANTITYQYDNDSLLKAVGAMTITRDPQNGQIKNGFLTGTTLGNATDTLTYNTFGELDTYTAQYSGADIYKNIYTRDKLGRITTKTETIDGGTITYEYLYDPAGRLETVKQNGVTTATYTYDSNGNRLTGPGVTVTSYDNQDRLLQYGNATYTYTPNGELLTKTVGAQTTTYTYDELGNLVKVILPNGDQIDYIIDGQNRRIGKKVNGTLQQGFLYQDQLKPIAELDGNGNIVSRFVYGTHVNVPDYMIKGGVTYRIITDHLGSVRLVVNTTTGSVAQRMDYDEFGNVNPSTEMGTGFQPFGFAGGLYDQHTKLVRFGARDYDAVTGRWTAKDPIGFGGGDANLYVYLSNDSINFTDKLGLVRVRVKGQELDISIENLHFYDLRHRDVDVMFLGYPINSLELTWVYEGDIVVSHPDSCKQIRFNDVEFSISKVVPPWIIYPTLRAAYRTQRTINGAANLADNLREMYDLTQRLGFNPYYQAIQLLEHIDIEDLSLDSNDCSCPTQ